MSSWQRLSPNAGFDAVKELYARYGLDMLSDEQLAEVVSDLTRDWRREQKRNRENRARARLLEDLTNG